jgi:hypothetical protein
LRRSGIRLKQVAASAELVLWIVAERPLRRELPRYSFDQRNGEHDVQDQHPLLFPRPLTVSSVSPPSSSTKLALTSVATVYHPLLKRPFALFFGPHTHLPPMAPLTNEYLLLPSPVPSLPLRSRLGASESRSTH